MDILTQGLLGGVMAQTAARPEERRLATLVGIFSGLLADADVLIRSSHDPLLTLEYHRHFTHSLLFVPCGALIASLLIFPFVRRSVTFQRLYLFALLGYLLSGVLDTCTSYGTHLLWPWVDERIAWHVISIIDPVFTVILLLSLLVMLYTGSRAVAITGILLAAGYLFSGYIQLQRAESLHSELLASRGHSAERRVVKPTLGNILVWRAVYIHQGIIYTDALRPGIFARARIYPGESVRQFELKQFQHLQGTTLYTDLQRFIKFSDNYVAFSPGHADIIGDIRYSMLATSVRPLWGIRFDTARPATHVSYEFFRAITPEEKQYFFSMLAGEEMLQTRDMQ